MPALGVALGLGTRLNSVLEALDYAPDPEDRKILSFLQPNIYIQKLCKITDASADCSFRETLRAIRLFS